MSDTNRESDPKAEALAAKIAQHFRDVPYPGDACLVALSDRCDPERLEIQSAFEGKSWRDLPLDFLRYHHESLFLFTPAAYQFYLPAYLLACTLSYEAAGNILSSVVFSLTLPVGFGIERTRFLDRMSRFSSSQKKTITAFLRLLRERHSEDFPRKELDAVLRSFWSRFR